MKKYQYIAIALGAVLFASCDDMLTTHYEGGTQDDDYIQATVEANPERVNSAVSGCFCFLYITKWLPMRYQSQ